MQLLETIRGFLTSLDKSKIYNEFSLQHELGFFLRYNHKEYTVEFERNISHFSIPKDKAPKKEIDIIIYTNDIAEKIAIELKCPQSGKIPENMYSFCKDIYFLEYLTHYGFDKGYFIAVTNDKLYFESTSTPKQVYRFFRIGEIITGRIEKPTGNIKEHITIKNEYTAEWIDIGNGFKCILISVT